MSSNKKYWKSVEELDVNSSIVDTLRNNEFVEEIPTDEFLGDKASLSSSATTRRDFLKYVGFTTAAASLAACEGPVHKSIPYVLQPEQIIPGVADYYATTVFDGFDFANLLVKTREGRPIKIDNNTIAGADFAANARVHASILSLYDGLRLKEPKIAGKNATWTNVDADVKASLAEAKAKGGQVVLLTNTLASPSTEKLIGEFIAKNPTAKQYHRMYTQISLALLLALVVAQSSGTFLKPYNGKTYSGVMFTGAAPITLTISDTKVNVTQGESTDTYLATKCAPSITQMSCTLVGEENKQGILHPSPRNDQHPPPSSRLLHRNPQPPRRRRREPLYRSS